MNTSVKLQKKLESHVNSLSTVHHLEVVHNQSTVKPFYVVEDAVITGKNIEVSYYDETTDDDTKNIEIRVINVLNYIDQFIGTEKVSDSEVKGEHVQYSYEYPALQNLMDNTTSIVQEFINAKGISHE